MERARGLPYGGRGDLAHDRSSRSHADLGRDHRASEHFEHGHQPVSAGSSHRPGGCADRSRTRRRRVPSPRGRLCLDRGAFGGSRRRGDPPTSPIAGPGSPPRPATSEHERRAERVSSQQLGADDDPPSGNRSSAAADESRPPRLGRRWCGAWGAAGRFGWACVELGVGMASRPGRADRVLASPSDREPFGGERSRPDGRGDGAGMWTRGRGPSGTPRLRRLGGRWHAGSWSRGAGGPYQFGLVAGGSRLRGGRRVVSRYRGHRDQTRPRSPSVASRVRGPRSGRSHHAICPL